MVWAGIGTGRLEWHNSVWNTHIVALHVCSHASNFTKRQRCVDWGSSIMNEIHLCICYLVCGYVYVHTCLCVCLWRPEAHGRCLHYETPLYVLRLFSLPQVLAGQWAPGIHSLFLPRTLITGMSCLAFIRVLGSNLGLHTHTDFISWSVLVCVWQPLVWLILRWSLR